MARLIELTAGERIPEVTAHPLAAPVDARDLQRHRPDCHLMLVDESGVLRARASCWWSATPEVADHRVGLVGHYAAADEDSGLEVLRQALVRLEREGCTVAIGPMDGNTWRRYRFVAERGTEPPFFLEPDNPDEWREQFERAGFQVMATYTSALSNDLSREDARLAPIEAALAAQDITIRPFDPAAADEELRRIFRLSAESFTRNYLYTPLDEEEFLEQNQRLLPYVVPDLVLLAERDGELVGFSFVVPDVLQKSRGTNVDTVIVKTVAVSPAVARVGLGTVLVAQSHRRAHELGFRRAIHALMHEQNVSQHISRHYARTIRRYALYVRPLTRDARP